jgi:hypothetical protein
MFCRTGTVAVDSQTGAFKLYPHRAILHSAGDGHPEWAYTEQISKDPETMCWQFGDHGYGGTALLPAYASSAASAFYPWHLARTRP